MKLAYTVSKEKGGLWYAHANGFQGIPCMIDGCSTFGDKRNALNNAAIMMGLTYKDYMQLRGREKPKEYSPKSGKVR